MLWFTSWVVHHIHREVPLFAEVVSFSFVLPSDVSKVKSRLAEISITVPMFRRDETAHLKEGSSQIVCTLHNVPKTIRSSRLKQRELFRRITDVISSVTQIETVIVTDSMRDTQPSPKAPLSDRA